MLQKFKITAYAFTVFCAVFMTLPVNTSAQLEVSEEGWEALSAGDLETADSDLLSLIMGMSETIEKMSETITELESKLAVIEYDLELATGKVEQTEEDLSTLVKWTGTGFMDGGSIQKNYMTLFQNAKEERQSVRLPSSGHMFMT